MGCGKNLVDRAIAATGDDAINFSSASFSNGFAGQSCSVAGFPSDPHFHNLTVLAQCANSRAPLLLEPWAVQAALRRRRGGQRLTEEELEEVRRCTRNPETLRWPRGTGR